MFCENHNHGNKNKWFGPGFPDELTPTTTVGLFDVPITFSDIHQLFSRSARVHFPVAGESCARNGPHPSAGGTRGQTVSVAPILPTCFRPGRRCRGTSGGLLGRHDHDGPEVADNPPVVRWNPVPSSTSTATRPCGWSGPRSEVSLKAAPAARVEAVEVR